MTTSRAERRIIGTRARDLVAAHIELVRCPICNVAKGPCKNVQGTSLSRHHKARIRNTRATIARLDQWPA